MKIFIFTCKNDRKLLSHHLLRHPNVQPIDIRQIHDSCHNPNTIILLTQHSTNQTVIRYVRKKNILTPIYMVSCGQIYYKGTNGIIPFNQLSYETLCQRLSSFPQQFIWSYVFEKDLTSTKRKNLATQVD